MGIPPFANRVTLPEIRKEELIASCRAIGIQDLRMLGFHDKMIEFEDPQLLDNTLLVLLEELTPSLVITFIPAIVSIPITMPPEPLSSGRSAGSRLRSGQ